MDTRRVELIVGSPIGPTLSTALQGFDVTIRADGCTSIVGELPDQSALIGLIELLDELHADIVSVKSTDA